MSLIDKFFGRAIKRGQLTVVYPGGKRATYGQPDPEFPDVTMRITKRSVFAAILRDPSLGAAESYMDGKLVIDEGDILSLLHLFTANNPWENSEKTLNPSKMRQLFNGVVHRVDRFNMARSSKRNVAHHYDLSDRLYDLFLDADRQYSCAYYTDPSNSLEQAQLDKKAHIVAKMDVKPEHRVLDIGCGWGGMALYIHRVTGAEVLGVTLSEEQLKVARRRAEEAGVADKVKFELIDYRALTGTFDRIVSVGMFEHVGPPQYREFFTQCRKLLTQDGTMLLHTIGRMGPPDVTDHFTAKYIFPGGYIPALSETMRAFEDVRLFLTDVEVLRLHYGYTLKAWYDRTVAAKDEIVALYDERFYRMWLFYLAGSHVSFMNGQIVNFQLQYSRSRTALPITRDYMIDAERKLAETAVVPAARAAE